MKYEFYLEGLGCANCAAKMEKKIKELEGVNFASIDFVNKKLVIETENVDIVSKKAEEIIKGIESHVNMVSIKDEVEKEDKIDKGIIIKYLIGVVLFISMLFMKNGTSKLIFSLTSYVLIGGDIVYRAFKNILKGQVFDENFLMTVATFGAFLIGELPEAISVMLFYKIGETLQDMAVDKSRKSIKKLLSLKAECANLVKGEEILKVKPEELNLDDIILIKPGERVPVDGVIIDGRSSLDVAALTGESIPSYVEQGSYILSGSINLEGVLKVRVLKTYQNSTVKKILDLVENAASKKAKTENFITKFARYYTPAVVGLAFILAVIPPVLGFGDFKRWIYRALVFLVVSCPCALVISIPLSFFGGIGLASKRGILIKGSSFIEALCEIKAVVFDKTGTLTWGRFEVSEIVPLNGFSKEEVLKYAALLESFSNHPIAVSIVKEYKDIIDKTEVKDFKEISGCGVWGKIFDKEVAVGNSKLMRQLGINLEENINLTTVYVAVNGVLAGVIKVTDSIKSSAKEVIDNLKKQNIKTFILTGDNKASAYYVADKLGIDEYYFELLPQDKVEKFNVIKNSLDGKVAFVGDGINDAPVLKLSDVGIAMGALGQDAAIEAADVVITTDEIEKVYEAIKISKYTRKIVVQNIILALSIKVLVLILAAFGLSNMWEAVFADVGVALLAVINSRRIIK
ncbi:Lead, cadmium, zinc and mercury transporting ATPase; Copper-translocating P-type ATPase [Thermobrachium celere DSM 8682]|uniref:Cd(2+)-exporting ATPase n=1 Tax=Thermobrachium celere DSM 8682 TaxID=941824 RepID=R7RQN0_9CLOT|nr:Lead, cadmium, zinc and mercury transporting ATPase; Copper-translocating P-type ATPase [Thermobrachium celere DSM 8682]